MAPDATLVENTWRLGSPRPLTPKTQAEHRRRHHEEGTLTPTERASPRLPARALAVGVLLHDPK